MMNLDRLFPGYAPILCRKSMRDWAGADVEFTDPSGCRHVVEVKYGAPANHVIDQALSYALDTIPQAAVVDAHFPGMPEDEQVRFVACRIAAFWTGTRADKWKRDTSLPPAERDWEALARELARRPETSLTRPACEGLARDLIRDWPVPPLPGKLSAVHFHLAVPEPDKIHAGQLHALARLRWRGHRATVWQVAAKLDGLSGTFSIREYWIPPTDTSRSGWAVPQDASPKRVRVGEVVATLFAGNPEHPAAGAVWSHQRDEKMSLGHGWYGDFPALELKVEDDAHGCRLRLYADVINPASLKAIHGAVKANEVTRARQETIAAWVLRCAPPADPELAAAARGLRRGTKRWETIDRRTGLKLAVWHSGSLNSASITIPLDRLSSAVDVAGQCIDALMFEGRSRKTAFGPEAVPL